MGENIYKVPKGNKKTGSKTGDTSDLMSTHYKVPKSYHSTSSGSDDENPSRNNLTDPPFSPDHYEMGPYFESENGSTIHPIYQNANFDHPMSPTDGVTHQSHIYQNVDYDGPSQQQNGKEKLTKKLNYKDDEYVNPEEFENGKEVLNVGKKQNGLPTNFKYPGMYHCMYNMYIMCVCMYIINNLCMYIYNSTSKCHMDYILIVMTTLPRAIRAEGVES